MDTPKAPDPKETAAAQSQMNRETAITQAGLNSTNQVTPWGNLTYTQSGTWDDGTPQFTATTSLSPEQQELYNLSTSTQKNLGNIGVEQSSKIRDLLGTNVDMSNEAVESRLFDLGSKRLNPAFAERETQMRQDLLNRGIREGTPAFESEMRRFNESRNDAFNQLALTGRGQAMQELLTERNQPINEITALLSGSQVQSPQFQSTPQTPVSGVDYAGLVNNNYNQQVASNNSMLGGLAGLGGSLIGGWAKSGFMMPSDRRLKEGARVVGRLENGLPVWAFRYRGGDTTMLGLMADEVEQIRPEAVGEVSGFKLVDYDLAAA
jgi:hypothetical protein